MKRFFLLILIIPSLLLGQTKDELDLCIAIQGNSFSTNTAAENALNRILNTIGASKNFVLSPCDKINNAVATAYKGTRYILYDRDFMNLINRNTNSWSSLFILAHEVGHHINGHSIDILLYAGDVVEPSSLAKKRQQELEADSFAAFVLAKLGASLYQLNEVINNISDDRDDTYSTHPRRSKRLASVKSGFEKANGTSNKNISSNTSKSNSSNPETYKNNKWPIGKRPYLIKNSYLFEQPSVYSRNLMTVKKYDNISFISPNKFNDNFYYVRVRGINGYLHGSGIEDAPRTNRSSTPPREKSYKENNNPISQNFDKSDLLAYVLKSSEDDYLYQEPSFSSKTIIEIKIGDYVRLMKGPLASKFWLKVYFKGRVGYINKSFFENRNIPSPVN